MKAQAKLMYKGRGSREFEIAAESHLYIKEDGGDGIYWEWQKISVLHDELLQILSQAEENMIRIRKLLPDIPRNAIK